MKSKKYTVRLKEPIANQVEKTGQRSVDFIRSAVLEKLENGGKNYHQQIASIYNAIDELADKHPDVDFSKVMEVLENGSH